MAEASYTEVERAILTLVKCFFEHSCDEGRKETLSLAEFTKLASKELPNLLKNTSLEEKMKELDINQDNELKFKEYFILIAELSKNVKREIKGKKKP